MANLPQYCPQAGLEVGKPQYHSEYPLQSPQPSHGQIDQAGLEYVPARPVHQGGKDRTICGLRTTTFWLVLALIFVIISAAVGGGVGGSIAVNNVKKSIANQRTIYRTTTVTESATQTTTSSASSTVGPITVPTTGYLAIPCPATSTSDQLTTVTLGTESTQFTITCGQDFTASFDILAIVTYTLEDCARACASYNRNNGSLACKGATFNSALSNIVLNFGTCFLKSDTKGAFVQDYDSYAGLVLTGTS